MIVFVKSSPIFNGTLSPIIDSVDGNKSVEKKIPENNIEPRLIRRFITFPTLKIITNAAENNPIPMNGREQ